MDNLETGANVGEFAAPQTDNSNVDVNTSENPAQDTGVNNSTVTESKPVQDKETNSAFAEMRRAREAAEAKATQLERDYNYFAKYNNLGVKNEAELKAAYGHQGINSWEDVDRYYEAQDAGIDPEVYNKIVDSERTAKEALEKLSKYEKRELMQQQAEQLSKDSKWGSFFNSNKDEILQTADKFGLDLQTAKLLVLEQKYEQPNMEEIKQNAVKEYIEKVKNGNVPVEGSGNTAIVNSGAPKTFKDAFKQSMAYLKATQK